MTIFIVIVVIVAVIFFFSRNTSDGVAEYHEEKGGLRKSFKTFSNYLSNDYNMDLALDTGKKFSYKKTINDSNGNKGTLVIGVENNLRNDPMIFSSFTNENGTKFKGLNISGIDFQDKSQFDRLINKSIDRLKEKSVISYSFSANQNESINKQNIEKKSSHNKVQNNGSIFDEFANRLFKPYNISEINIMENMAVFETPLNFRNDFEGTPSARKISEILPQFITLFVAAFPDVYLWYLEDSKNNSVYADMVFQMKDRNKSLEQLIKEDPDFAIRYYIALVSEFKDYKQLNKLECSE